METSIGHIQLNINPANIPFYKGVLAHMGWQLWHEDANMLGMGASNGASVWCAPKTKDVANDYDGPGMNHLGFAAETAADVDSVAEYLTGQGVTLLFDTPRHRPEFAGGPDQTYYQIMFESPDRILFEVVYIGPKDA